jgi:hypothetical protein
MRKVEAAYSRFFLGTTPLKAASNGEAVAFPREAGSFPPVASVSQLPRLLAESSAEEGVESRVGAGRACHTHDSS